MLPLLITTLQHIHLALQTVPDNVFFVQVQQSLWLDSTRVCSSSQPLWYLAHSLSQVLLLLLLLVELYMLLSILCSHSQDTKDICDPICYIYITEKHFLCLFLYLYLSGKVFLLWSPFFIFSSLADLSYQHHYFELETLFLSWLSSPSSKTIASTQVLLPCYICFGL